MDDYKILGHLEVLAERLEITVSYEPLEIDGSYHSGGFCRIKGKDIVIINKKSSVTDKIIILVDTLKRYDLSQIYILPSIRAMLHLEEDH